MILILIFYRGSDLFFIVDFLQPRSLSPFARIPSDRDFGASAADLRTGKYKR
jgi:hypothetical protein